MAMLHHPERLRGVYPKLYLFANAVAANATCDVCVVSGCRTAAMQLALWEEGRNTVGPNAGKHGHASLGDTVTQAKELKDTAHARGAAIDLQFQRDGKLLDAGSPDNLALYKWLGLMAEEAGLTWGGNWHTKDYAHCELKGWRSLSLLPPVQTA